MTNEYPEICKLTLVYLIGNESQRLMAYYYIYLKDTPNPFAVTRPFTSIESEIFALVLIEKNLELAHTFYTRLGFALATNKQRFQDTVARRVDQEPISQLIEKPHFLAYFVTNHAFKSSLLNN